MALIKGKAYSISNLSFLDGSLLNGLHLTFTKAYYYKSKEEQYTNVRKMTYAYDSYAGYKYIFLFDENNIEIDRIRIDTVNDQIYDMYYLSFILENADSLDDTRFIGLTSIDIYTGNDSIIKLSPTQEFKMIYNGIAYNQIDNLPQKIENIEIVADDGFTFLKREQYLRMFNWTRLPVGWDIGTDEDGYAFLPITKAVLNGLIVKISDIPFERTANHESFMFSCQPYDLADKLELLDNAIQPLSILKINGIRDIYHNDNITYGDSITLEYSLINHHFTVESIDIVKQMLIDDIADDGTIEEYCDHIDIQFDDGKLLVTFNQIIQSIYTLFDVVLSSTSLKEVKAIPNPTISFSLTGCTVNIISGTQFEYGSEITIDITTTSGYNEENKNIQILENGNDITSQCLVTDSRIIILRITDNIEVIIKASQKWNLKIKDYSSTVLLNIDVTQIINNVRLIRSSNNQYTLRIDDDSYLFTYTVPQNKKVIGIGFDNNILLYINSNVQELNLLEYSTGGNETTLYLLLRDESELPTTFSMNVYNMNCETNYVDKTNYINFVTTLDGSLRDSCSIFMPIVLFEYASIPTFNYVFIPVFNRYYYVTEITNIRTGLWQLSLKCDVLMTFKDEIRSQTCMVARNEYTYNKTIADPIAIKSSRESTEVIDLTLNDNPFENGIDNADGIVVEVISGSNPD